MLYGKFTAVWWIRIHGSGPFWLDPDPFLDQDDIFSIGSAKADQQLRLINLYQDFPDA